MDGLIGTPKKKKKNQFSADAISQALANSSSSDSPSSYYAPPKSSEIAPAAAQALQLGASPDILSKAQKYLGNKDFVGLCESFVNTVTGAPHQFVSAIDDFNHQKDKVRTDFQNMPVGSQIFYSANEGNNNDGHTTIYAGNGQQIGATNSGIRQTDIQKWSKSTSQQALGYIPPATTGAQTNG